MTKSKGALALGLVIVVVAALLAIFNQSRTFAQFMGPDYDPGKLDNIQIFLSAIDNDTPSREITLTPEDPAAQELLALLNRQTYDLIQGDSRMKLSLKEYQIMEMLLSNPGQILPKERFIEKIWGYESDVEYNNIEVYISFLRKKLTAIHSTVQIRTARGIGYFLEKKA